MITVSVIIPSYNHAKYIEETLFSCLDQDYKGFIEIIIVDDNSTDNTKDILSLLDFSSYVSRSVSVIYKEKNQGLNDSIDIGLSMAKGKYIQILASDDVLCLDKISKQVVFLEKYNCDCVYSRGFLYSDGICEEYYLNSFNKMYLLGRGLEFVSTKDWGGPLTQSGLFKRELLLELKDIRSDYKSDDWAMLITIFKKYSPGYYDEPLFLYRQHNDNSYTKYWQTFPMRIDVASRLVDEKYRLQSISNILLSHADYLLSDKEKVNSFKFLAASSILSLNSLSMRARVILKGFLPNKIWLSIIDLKKSYKDK